MCGALPTLTRHGGLCLRARWQDEDGNTYMGNVATALANGDAAAYETFLEPVHDDAGTHGLRGAVASALYGPVSALPRPHPVLSPAFAAVSRR